MLSFVRMRHPSSEAERTADLFPRLVALTSDALGVDPQQDGHAVACHSAT